MFHFWSADQVKTAIMRMEEQLTTGASQIASPTEGSATLLSRNQALKTLDDLFWAYEAKTGEKIERRPSPGMKIYQITVDKDRHY